MDIGHWEFPHEFNPDEWFGFIYRITEIDTGREYIGKKQFTKLRRKTIKNRVNKKHVRSESDWRTYTGSSTELNEAIAKKDLTNYKFEIQSLHKTKGSLHYAEIKTQITEEVLRAVLPNGQRKYFNKCINSVRFLPPNEHTEETRMKIKKKMVELVQDGKYWMHQLPAAELEEWVNKNLRELRPVTRYRSPEEYQQWINDNLVGENNPMYGIVPAIAGKSWEEFYGVERAEELRKKLSDSITKIAKRGEDHPLYGKNRPQEVCEKISRGNKGKRTGPDNSMYGKPCHYKMTEEEKEQWKKNVGDSVRGLKRSEETRNRMSAASKGKKMATVTCPHCNKIGGRGNMMRYHFDFCKSKNLEIK